MLEIDCWQRDAVARQRWSADEVSIQVFGMVNGLYVGAIAYIL